MKYTLQLSDVADEDVRGAILAPLIEYNTAKAGPSNYRPLVVSVLDAQGDVVGGLWGFTSFDWLFTELLAVPPAFRGQGVGSALIQRAETEAIARGCRGAWLDTFEFQAREFYERNGYVSFAELADFPPGFSRLFMRKALRFSSSEA